MQLARDSTWVRRVALLFGGLVVANLPFLVLQQHFNIERALVNVDLLLALVIMSRRPWVGLLILVVFWVAEGVVSQSMTYHFVSPLAFLESARYMSAMHPAKFLGGTVLAVAVAFAGAAFLTSLAIRQRRADAGAACALLLVLAIVDVANGSSLYSMGDRRVLPVNMAGSPSATLFRQWRVGANRQPLTEVRQELSLRRVVDVSGWAQSHLDRSIWLVLVESFGVHVDDRLRGWVGDQLLDAGLEDRYEASLHELPFKGATTAGELRALCDLEGSYALIDPPRGSGCWPARLAAEGWQTMGFHGFSRHMFDRELWWPLIGLQQRHFLDDLPGLAQCGGVFKGVCDEALLRRSAQELRLPRRFVYTLTLNTHLPLDQIAIPTELRRLCDQRSAREQVCELTAALGMVMQTVGDAAKQLDGPLPLIVVMGDHAPPFVDKQSLREFKSDDVPIYVLRPKR